MTDAREAAAIEMGTVYGPPPTRNSGLGTDTTICAGAVPGGVAGCDGACAIVSRGGFAPGTTAAPSGGVVAGGVVAGGVVGCTCDGGYPGVLVAVGVCIGSAATGGTPAG